MHLWGGAECTVVRIRDTWRDQTRDTGHHDRDGDLDLIAALGIRTLRVPILWERCVPGPVHVGWDWHDARMARLQKLGIQPIVGLIHHGSGPPGTDPLNLEWAEGLAQHAGRVAERYPWVTDWTPVNEPLTTARFSAMYGFWHPHGGSEEEFEAMVHVQCRAVMLAMRAIRRHVPNARLVQTEDAGCVFSTPRLAHQAEYENERRWLSLDLLCGRVDQHHRWWQRLLDLGVPQRALDELRECEAAPDVLGVNHYVTSDRFLDHRVHNYPKHLHGGNGRDVYVDTEAARVGVDGEQTGWLPRLREVWQRYRRPLAITEVHLGGADEHEQVRWLMEAWQAAHTLVAEGADVRAVTAWALFGNQGWSSLLRDAPGSYEPGLWDVRHAAPQPTLVAQAAAALACDGNFSHLCLDREGWWRRDDRFHQALRTA